MRESVVSLTIRGIDFKHDSSKISGRKSIDRLREASRYLAEIPDQVVTVVGHASCLGGWTLNKCLSRGRAKRVKQWFKRVCTTPACRKLKAANIRFIGCGEDHPIADNRSNSGQSENRRVEFIMGETTEAKQCNRVDKFLSSVTCGGGPVSGFNCNGYRKYDPDN